VLSGAFSRFTKPVQLRWCHASILSIRLPQHRTAGNASKTVLPPNDRLRQPGVRVGDGKRTHRVEPRTLHQRSGSGQQSVLDALGKAKAYNR
jgi:hypothetical protein